MHFAFCLKLNKSMTSQQAGLFVLLINCLLLPDGFSKTSVEALGTKWRISQVSIPALIRAGGLRDQSWFRLPGYNLAGVDRAYVFPAGLGLLQLVMDDWHNLGFRQRHCL